MQPRRHPVALPSTLVPGPAYPLHSTLGPAFLRSEVDRDLSSGTREVQDQDVVREIWIVAGDAFNAESWKESLEVWCRENDCSCMQTGAQQRIHTAEAVSQLLCQIDDSSLLAHGTHATPAEVARLSSLSPATLKGAYLHLIMSEVGWGAMPDSPWEAAHVNSLDKVLCTLRAFVDGRSLQETSGHEKFRSNFKGMHVFGSLDSSGSSCYLHLEPQVFAKHLKSLQRELWKLTDAQFVEAVFRASAQGENGIRVSRRPTQVLDILDKYATTGPSTVVVPGLV